MKTIKINHSCRQIYLRSTPHPVTVTTRIVTCLVGNPYKPSFATVTGWGEYPKYAIHRSYGIEPLSTESDRIFFPAGVQVLLLRVSSGTLGHGCPRVNGGPGILGEDRSRENRVGPTGQGVIKQTTQLLGE